MTLMLKVEDVNAIWLLLDRVGTQIGEELGAGQVRQSEILDVILRRVGELDARWSREQILEAWMHQAIGFIHAKGERLASEPTTPKENIAAWNAIAASEAAHVLAHNGQRQSVDVYVDAVMERLRATAIGASLSREQLWRAWVMKQIVDLAKDAQAPKPPQIGDMNIGRFAKKPGDLPS